MNKVIPIFCFIVLFSTFSCTKRIVHNTINQAKDTVLVSDKEKKEKIKTCINNIEYTSFSSKGKITYTEGNQSFTANFTLRMRKDSIIWLSGFLMGIEGARCLITKDSVFVVDKINNEYIKFSMANLSEKIGLNVNLELLQNLFIGNNVITETDSSVVTQDTTQTTISENINGLQIETTVNRSNCKIGSFKAKSPFSGQIKSTYAEFLPLNEFLFGNLAILKITLFSKNGPSYIEAVFNHNKTELNDKTQRYPFNIPNRYVQRK